MVGGVAAPRVGPAGTCSSATAGRLVRGLHCGARRLRPLRTRLLGGGHCLPHRRTGPGTPVRHADGNRQPRARGEATHRTFRSSWSTRTPTTTTWATTTVSILFWRQTATTRVATHAASTTSRHDQFVPAGSIWKPTPPGFATETWSIQPWAVDQYIADGDIIDLGGRSLEVLLTPGHAPDALCLLDRDSGLLFTGDTYYRGPLFAHLPGSDLRSVRHHGRAPRSTLREVVRNS